MLDFAKRYLPEGTAVYHGDALDKEFNGVVPAGSYVLRNRGEKPDQFLADRSYIGEEIEDVVEN